MGVALALLVLPIALAVQIARDKNAVDLQICIEVEHAPLSWTCRQALRFHRFGTAEVGEMNASAGLWHVAAHGDPALAKDLLTRWQRAGADIDARSSRVRTAWTALHIATLEPSPQGVRLLLQAGARFDQRDADGKTAIDLAREAQQRHPDRDYRDVLRLLEGAAVGR